MYRRNRGSKYKARMLDLQGNFIKEIYATDAAKLRDDHPNEYKKYKFESTQKDPAKRREVVPVLKNNICFFKYKSSGLKMLKGGEKLPHWITKHAIASAINNLAIEGDALRCIDNKTKKEFYIWPTEAVVEAKTPFVTDEENPNAHSFSADVGVSFYKSEPKELLEKYQGGIAIEVADSHYIEPDKKQSFLEHGIAIFEYALNRRKWGLRERMNEDERERVMDIMEEKFQEAIFGRIESDPISIKTANKKMKEAQDELSLAKMEIESLLYQNKKLERTNEEIKRQMTERIRQYECENKRLRNEIEIEKNKSIFCIIKGRFKR